MTRPSTFEAFALPEWAELDRAQLETTDVNGIQVRCPRVTAEPVQALARGLRRAGPELWAWSALQIADALGSVGDRFLDPSDPLRRQAIELLPATSGLSPEMAAAVLDGMASDWTGPRIRRMLDLELGGPAVLDGFQTWEERRVLACGPSLTFQVVAGSVPGVGVSALIRSLVVRSPTLLKPGWGDVVLPVLFARALAEAHPALARMLAVLYWPGGDSHVEEVLLAEADVATVYGGDASVAAIRSRAPATTRVVAYHHRVSLGIVSREALAPEQLHRTASEVAVFDQRGCVSPHSVYVESGEEGDVQAFVAELAQAMRAVEAHLPGGRMDPREASAVHQARGTAELLAASGSGEVHHGGTALWTVILDPDA